MRQEHTGFDDSTLEFTSSNGVTTTSAIEWEVVVSPRIGHEYPDRFAPTDSRHRTLRPMSELLPKMDEQNRRLAEIKQGRMVQEELLAARLYTGPMYHKYNLVLRAFSGVAFLREQCQRDCRGNLYPTTIHGINSAVIKLSKLQAAVPVYRGSTRAVLPASFFARDEYGLSGGVEFGFTSTTVERAQAVHYAKGQAATVFESEMGLIDRGADISWLSQFPHEREVLFGPLLGQQPLATRVQGSTLVVATRMSLNMLSLTLEQVLHKRHRLVKEMAAGMVLEVRGALAGSGVAVSQAAALRSELHDNILAEEPEHFNEDAAFVQAVERALQRKNERSGAQSALAAMKGLTPAELVPG